MINHEEQIIIESLNYQGYKNLEYEPDGNIPPDIVINKQIAIEVRRLNQKDKDLKGIEEDSFWLRTIIENILKSESDNNHTSSLFIGYTFKRPLPPKKKIISSINAVLKEFKTSGLINSEIKIEDSITLEFFESETILENQFEVLLVNDLDSGGFALPLLIRNIKLAVAEKDKKINSVKDHYPIWWLALVDTIGYGIRDDELEIIKHSIPLGTSFKRILIVSPIDYQNFTYIDF